RRDAGRNAFLTRECASRFECGLIADCDDLVDYTEIEHVGHEARADALDLVRSGLAPREHCAVLRLDRDDAQRRPSRLEHLTYARDRAAGADAGNEEIDVAAGVVPDLLRGGAAMDLGICRVLELLRDHGAGNLARKLLGAGDGARHSLRRRREL